LTHFPDVTLVKDGVSIDPKEYSREPNERRGGARVIDSGRVYEYFHAGATVQIQGAQLRLPSLADFCRQLEIELTQPVQANIYITPRHARGLDLHFDSHDVLVLQVFGRKRWELYGRSVDAPLEKHIEIGVERTPLVLETELSAGDVLYFPRGFPHRVESTETASVHVTLGLIAQTWADAFREVLAYLDSDSRFRQSLPVRYAYAEQETVQAIKAMRDELTTWLAELDPRLVATWLADAFWAGRPRNLNGQLQQLLTLEDVTDQSIVVRPASRIARPSSTGAELRLIFGDTGLALPGQLAEAIDFILARREFPVSELRPFLDEGSRLVLVKRLIREGLLQRRVRPGLG
jgi:bifunctional lysine-specific demethylase and histidyl-hydroxylase NO66